MKSHIEVSKELEEFNNFGDSMLQNECASCENEDTNFDNVESEMDYLEDEDLQKHKN